MFESFFASIAIGAGMMAAAVFSPFSGATDSIQSQIRSASDRAAAGRTASSTVPIACVSAAVDARERAIVSAETTFTSALNTAYSTRASALHSAYAESRTEAIRSAVNTAWKAFTTATRDAQKKWKEGQNAAWKQFNTALRTCKAPNSVSDSKKASSEVRGE